MKFFIVATLVATYPLFCQDSDLCNSAEERHPQFRADNSSHLVPGRGLIGDRKMPEDCIQRRIVSASSPKPAGPVSLYQLRHKVPKKAKKEFTIGAQLIALGDADGAEAHFRKAIALDPGYMEAHNNLATRLMVAKRFNEGLMELWIAAALDPAASPVHSNLAFAFLKIGRFKDAEREAKLAIALDPTAPNPRNIALELKRLRQNKTISQN